MSSAVMTKIEAAASERRSERRDTEVTWMLVSSSRLRSRNLSIAATFMESALAARHGTAAASAAVVMLQIIRYRSRAKAGSLLGPVRSLPGLRDHAPTWASRDSGKVHPVKSWFFLTCVLLLLLALPVHAAPVFLEELTWTELRDAIGSGKTTVIVPIGGTEQNGPHMALGKHNARVKKLSERIATALGNAVVAPVIAYVPEGRIDPPTGHMRFPGTITVPDDAFEGVLAAAARSFRRHGFRDIVFLGDSGDYQKNVKAVAARLNREWAKEPARAHAIEEYYRAAAIAGHASADDTSLTLAIDPSLVRVERIGPDSRFTPAEGVQGDPRGASAAAGQRMADSIVSRTVDAIRKAVRR